LKKDKVSKVITVSKQKTSSELEEVVSIDKHRDAVFQWLAENVESYKTPGQIDLQITDFDWKSFSGNCKLFFDGIELSSIFDIGLDISGKFGLKPPIFNSPLGAPASYAAIKLTETTYQAINAELNQFLPKMLPYGINHLTGEMIDGSTPIMKRVIETDSFINIQGLIDLAREKVILHIKLS